jgi:ABC-2 type transport system permease protein
VPLFLTQLKFELLKMFSRKRTYIGFGAFVAMECVVLMICNLRGPQMMFRRMIEQNGYGFDEYFSGYTVAMLIVHWTSTLLGSLYLALIAGDLMAKEVEEGTMRMLLCRPVSRLRVTLLKYLASVIYTCVLIIFIGATALLAGMAYRGHGGLFVFFPEDHVFDLISPEHALGMYFAGMPLLALAMVSISSIGFLFSCCNMKPAAASIVTLSVVFVDFIFHGIPYFESIKVFFINTHLTAWMQIYTAHPPVWKMVEDYSYLLGLDFTCLIIGSAIFLQRDLK